MSKREDPQARQAYRVPRSPLDGFYQKGQPSAPVRIGAGNVRSIENTTVTVVIHDSIIPGVTYYTDQEPGVGDLAEVWSLDDVLFTPGFTNVDQRPPNLVMTNKPSPITADVALSGSFNDESWFFQPIDEPSWQREVTEQLVGLEVTRDGRDSRGTLWSDAPISVRPGDTVDFHVTASYLSGWAATMELTICWGPENTDPLPGDPTQQVVVYPPSVVVNASEQHLDASVTVPASLDTFVPLRARIGLRFTEATPDPNAPGNTETTYGDWTVTEPVAQMQGYLPGHNPPAGQTAYPLLKGISTYNVAYSSQESDRGALLPINADQTMRQTTADNAMGQVANAYLRPHVEGEGGVNALWPVAFWQSVVDGTLIGLTVNPPYKYTFSACNRDVVNWVSPNLLLPVPPGPKPPGADHYEYESNDWTLVSANLDYAVTGFARAFEDYDISALIDYRYSTNPDTVQHFVDAAHFPPGTPGITAPLPADFEYEMDDIPLATAGLPRVHHDEVLSGGYNDVEVLKDAGGSIDITADFAEQTQTVTEYFSDKSPAFGVAFSASCAVGGIHVGTVAFDQSGDITGAALNPVTTNMVVNYVLQPPRWRWVYKTQITTPGQVVLRKVDLRLDFAEATKVADQDRPVGQVWIDPGGEVGGCPTVDTPPASEECPLVTHNPPSPTADWVRSPGFGKVTVTAPPDTGGMLTITGQARFTGIHQTGGPHQDGDPLVEFRLASNLDGGQWPVVTLTGCQHFTLLGNVHLDRGEQAQVWAEYRLVADAEGSISLDKAFLSSTFLPGGHRPPATSRAAIHYWDGDQWRPPDRVTAEVAYGDAEVPDVPRTPTTTTLLVSPTTAYERDIVTMTARVDGGATTGQVLFSHATAADGPWTDFGSTPLNESGLAARTWVPTFPVTTYLRARYQGSPTHDVSEAVGEPVTIGGRLVTKTLTTQATWLATYDPSGGSINSGRVEQGLEDPAVGNRVTLLGYDLTDLPDDADVLTTTLRCTEWDYCLNPSGCTLVLGWHDHPVIPEGYYPDVFPQSEQQIIPGPLALSLDWLPRLLEESRDLFAGITVGPGTSDGSEYVGNSRGGEDTWSLSIVFNTRTA